MNISLPVEKSEERKSVGEEIGQKIDEISALLDILKGTIMVNGISYTVGEQLRTHVEKLHNDAEMSQSSVQ